MSAEHITVTQNGLSSILKYQPTYNPISRVYILKPDISVVSQIICSFPDREAKSISA